MKKITFAVAALLFAAAVQAQRSYYDDAIVRGARAQELSDLCHEIQAGYRLTPGQILHPQDPQVFPPGMLDTLKKYDWLNVTDYFYHTGTWDKQNDINSIEPLSRLTRYFEDGSSQNYCVMEAGYYDAILYMDHGGYLSPPVEIGQKYGYTWLFFTHTNDDPLRLVSYKNGVLMIDVSDSHPMQDVNYSRRFRDVYIAVPRLDLPEIRQHASVQPSNPW